MQSTTSNVFREQTDLAEHIAAIIPGILYIYDRVSGENLYCNRRVIDILGFTPGEISRLTEGFLAIIHPDDRFAVEASRKAFSPASEGAIRELRCRVRHKEGQWLCMQCRETLLTPNVEGEWRYILGIALDVTSVLEAEEKTRALVAKLQSAKEAAEFSSRAKSDVLMTMSQELRAPLNSVISLANLLDATTVNPTQKDCIRTIRESGESIQGIVDGVLRLSYTEAESAASAQRDVSHAATAVPPVGNFVPEAVLPAPETGFVPRPSSVRILMAEDNPVNRRVGKLILQRAGFSLDVVSHGQEAVEAHEKDPYDLILMDCQMPLLDGLKATEVIRKMPGPQPTIIAVTANALVGEREKCLAAGMDDYISKPFRADELVSIVKRWLEVRVK